MVLNIRTAIGETGAACSRRPASAALVLWNYNIALETTVYISALWRRSVFVKVFLFFLVANLKRVVVKMGNVACVRVGGACVFARHVCSCSRRHVSTVLVFSCVLSSDMLPVCIIGEKSDAKVDIKK